jgi:hypothetical protein
MAFFEDIFKGGNIITGLAIGVGAAIFAPVIGSVLSGIVKPAAKAGIKGGLRLYACGKATVESVGETVSDIVAEAGTELHEARESKHGPAEGKKEEAASAARGVSPKQPTSGQRKAGSGTEKEQSGNKPPL